MCRGSVGASHITLSAVKNRPGRALIGPELSVRDVTDRGISGCTLRERHVNSYAVLIASRRESANAWSAPSTPLCVVISSAQKGVFDVHHSGVSHRPGHVI